MVVLYDIWWWAAVRRTRYYIDTHIRRYPYARGYAKRKVLDQFRNLTRSSPIDLVYIYIHNAM